MAINLVNNKTATAVPIIAKIDKYPIPFNQFGSEKMGEKASVMKHMIKAGANINIKESEVMAVEGMSDNLNLIVVRLIA